MSTTPRKRTHRPQAPHRRGAAAAILDAAGASSPSAATTPPSIDDIARDGGVSKALIYEHFASKQELHAELLEQHAGELFERLAAAIADAGQGGAGAARRRVRRLLRASSRSTASPGGCCSARPPTPRRWRVLDRIAAAGDRAWWPALIAEDPARGPRATTSAHARARHPAARPDARGRRAVARQLVGRPPGAAARADRGDDDGLRLARARAAQPGRALAAAAAGVNFARDVVDAADPARPALVALGARRRAARDRLRRGGRPLRPAGRRAGRARRGPRRRGDDADRQPARVGLRDGRLLAPRGGGPALHRAAAARRPARAHGAGGAARGRGGRARRRTCSTQAGFDGAAARACRTSGCSRTPSRPPAAELDPERPGADRVHLGHRRRAQADPPRRALPRGPARAGRALVRRPAGRPVLVHGGERLVAVRAQRLRGGLAARRRGPAARRPLRPRRAARAARARAGRRALHVPHRVPRDRQARRAAPAARAAPRRGRRRAAQPRGGARVAGGGRAWRSTTATARPRPAR